MDEYDRFEYKGYTVKIYHDPDPLNPRTEFDGHLGTMVCFHSRYDLGDLYKKYNNKPVEHFLYDIVAEYESVDKVDQDYTDMSPEEFREKYIDKFNKYYVVLPLYLYDHSGITMNTTGFSCRWDSGQVGWIYVSKEKAKKEYGDKILHKKLRKQIENVLKAEVEEYDDYLTGNVYGYVIEKYGEEMDSCWGFFGDPNKHMIPDVKQIIDYYYEEEQKQNQMDYAKEIGGFENEMCIL